MSATDNAGYLYNFNNSNSTISPGTPPGAGQTVIENDPIGDIFRETEIKFITKDMYQKLRLPDGAALQPTYKQVKDAVADSRFGGGAAEPFELGGGFRHALRALDSGPPVRALAHTQASPRPFLERPSHFRFRLSPSGISLPNQ